MSGPVAFSIMTPNGLSPLGWVGIDKLPFWQTFVQMGEGCEIVYAYYPSDEVQAAAVALLNAVDENHSTLEPPLKFTVPWGEVVALRAAIAASTEEKGE